MPRKDLLEYLAERLKKAEDELTAFKAAIANHGLRIRERDDQGERDVTDRHLREAEETCEECRTLLREWSKE
jgi:hypothetical protein